MGRFKADDKMKGFTLVEVMIAVGISGIVIAGAIAVISTLMKETARLKAKSGVQEFRETVLDLLLNDEALKNMIEGTPSMSCLKDAASCTGAGGPVMIFTRTNTLFYDATNAASGFTPNGAVCAAGNDFSATGDGNAQCPFRLDLKWEPICDPGGCMAPQILFTGEIKVNAPSASLKQAGTGATLNIRVVRNTGVRPSSIVAIESGRYTTCVVYNDGNQGKVKCWGGGDGGILGRGVPLDEGTADYVVDTSGNPITGVKKIAMNKNAACVVTGAGTVLCWGDGYMGAAGRGELSPTPVYQSAAPVLVSIPAGSPPQPLTGMANIFPLRNGFCATSTTNIYCWGASYQLGTLLYRAPGSPMWDQQHTSWEREWHSIAEDITPQLGGTPWTKFFGFETTLCVLVGANKELSCWGSNQFGNLAFTPTNSGAEQGCNPPAPPPFHTFCATGLWGPYSFNANRKISAVGSMSNPSGPTTGPTLQNVKDLKGGEKHLCALLETGEVVCWGYNAHGQIGDGTYLGETSSPPAWTSNCLSVRNDVSFVRAAYLRDEFYWKWANCTGADTNGDGHFTETDLIWTWEGNTPEPAIAHPRPAYVRHPTAAGNLTNIVQLDSQFDHTCAVNNLGEAYCWGFNTSGQVGGGAETTVVPYGEPRPVKVSSIPAGERVKAVTTGESHSCALTESGKVYCWGGNWAGQLNQPKASSWGSYTAVEITGLEP